MNEHNIHQEHSEHKGSEHNPTPVPLPAHPVLYVDREFKFSFKKQTVVNELGEEVKRPPVTLTVPIPTFQGIVAAIDADPKVIQLVLDMAEESIKDQIRSLLTDEEHPVNRQEDLDLSKLTLSFIANLPKSERTGGGIAKDTWAEWEKDYIETMVAIRGDTDPKAAEKVGRAAKLFTGRLNQCRTDKPVLKYLREQLALWATKSKNVDDFGDVFQYLDGRATELLNKDSASLLANL